MVKVAPEGESPLVEIGRMSQIVAPVGCPAEDETPCGPRRCFFVNGGGEAVEQYMEQASDHMSQAGRRIANGFADQAGQAGMKNA